MEYISQTILDCNTQNIEQYIAVPNLNKHTIDEECDLVKFELGKYLNLDKSSNINIPIEDIVTIYQDNNSTSNVDSPDNSINNNNNNNNKEQNMAMLIENSLPTIESFAEQQVAIDQILSENKESTIEMQQQSEVYSVECVEKASIVVEAAVETVEPSIDIGFENVQPAIEETINNVGFENVQPAIEENINDVGFENVQPAIEENINDIGSDEDYEDNISTFSGSDNEDSDNELQTQQKVKILNDITISAAKSVPVPATTPSIIVEALLPTTKIPLCKVDVMPENNNENDVQTTTKMRGPIVARKEIKAIAGNNNAYSSDDSSSDSSDDDDDVDILSTTTSAEPSRISQRSRPASTPVKSRIVLSLATRKYLTPTSVAKPKLAIKEVKHNHILHKLDENYVELPTVVFDISDINSIFYDADLNLSSLKDISSKFLKKGPIHLAPSNVGSVLKELSGYSLSESNMIFKANEVSSSHVYPIEYPLVYGAVPTKSASAARYFINYGYKQLRDANKTNNDTVVAPKFTPFADGQLEIMTYSYWLLESQDLIRWRNDLKMTKLKCIFKYLVSNIDENYVVGEGSTSFKLKDRLCQFADFEEPFYISDQCMLVVKINFEAVVNSLKHKYGRTEQYYEALNTWKYFLQKCNIHHYICEHTLHEIHALTQKMEIILNGRLADVQSIYYRYSKNLTFKQNQVFDMLKFYKPLRAMKDITETLQHCVGNFFTTFIKLLARHLVEYRIISNCHRVSYEKVEGFMIRYKHLCSIQDYTNVIPLAPKPIQLAMTRVLAYELESLDFHFKNAKIDADAIKLLNAFINGSMMRALEPLVYGNLKVSAGECADTLERTLNEFFNLKDFVGNNSDLWHQNYDSDNFDSDSDDDDDDNDSDNSSTSSSSSNSSSDESDNDDDDEFDKNAGNGDDIKSELNALIVGDSLSIPQKREPKNKKTTATMNTVALGVNIEPLPLTLDGDKMFIPQKKIINNKYFKNLVATSRVYVEKEQNKSRLKCVMCHNASTNKMFGIGDDIMVSCCMQCAGNLIEDTNRPTHVYDHEAIKSRILSNCKPPIAFNMNGSFREHGDMVFNCNVQYNKLKRHQNSTTTQQNKASKKLKRQ